MCDSTKFNSSTKAGNIKKEMITAPDISKEKILQLLEEVNDPEVPVLSVMDLGIVRGVEIKDGKIIISITPTYSGCPAMDVIRMNIRLKMLENGYKNTEIKTILSPAWTTEWMTQSGKQKLKAFGIAPPNPSHSVCDLNAFQEDEAVQCPHCNSYNTQIVSRFGSTACKALYKCNDCSEPFDYFRSH